MSTKLVLAALFLSLAACKHKAPDPGVAEKVEVTARPTEATAAAVRELATNFARIHFEYDSARLSADAKAALEANATILGAHPELKVEVQGHADERGTIDYNLALGQRRANSVVSYLTNQGVAPSRLPVITYGEERPLTSGSYETAWAQNRRAEFRILTGTATVQGTTDR